MNSPKIVFIVTRNVSFPGDARPDEQMMRAELKSGDTFFACVMPQGKPEDTKMVYYSPWLLNDTEVNGSPASVYGPETIQEAGRKGYSISEIVHQLSRAFKAEEARVCNVPR